MGGQKAVVILVLLRPYSATHCARTREIAPGVWSGTFPKGSSICICLMFRCLQVFYTDRQGIWLRSAVLEPIWCQVPIAVGWEFGLFLFAPDVILHESCVSLPPPATTQYELNSCNAKMNCSSEDAETWNAKCQRTKQMGVQVVREIRPLTASLGALFLNICFI